LSRILKRLPDEGKAYGDYVNVEVRKSLTSKKEKFHFTPVHHTDDEWKEALDFLNE